jgi:hypothetical protein
MAVLKRRQQMDWISRALNTEAEEDPKDPSEPSIC